MHKLLMERDDQLPLTSFAPLVCVDFINRNLAQTLIKIFARSKLIFENIDVTPSPKKAF
jgi:hypothetical protein